MKRRGLLGLLAAGTTTGCLRLEQSNATATRDTTDTDSATTTTDESPATTTQPTTTEEPTETETTEEPTEAETTEEPTEAETTEEPTETEESNEERAPITLTPTWNHPDDIVTGVWTSDGSFYTSNEDWLRKFDPDGVERWRTTPFPEDTYSQVVAFDTSSAVVALRSTDDATTAVTVIAYDDDDGTVRWTHTGSDDGQHGNTSAIAIGNDTAALATGDSGTCSDSSERITALEESTGDVRWQADIDGVCVNDLHVVNDHVVANTTDGHVAFEIESGARAATTNQTYGFGRFETTDGILYGGFETIEARTVPEFSKDWQQTVSDRLTVETRPLVTDDAVVTGTQAGTVVAVERTDGGRRWRTQMTEAVTGIARSSAFLWAGDDAGTVSAFDPESGEQYAVADADTTTARQFGAVNETLLIEGQAYRIERT